MFPRLKNFFYSTKKSLESNGIFLPAPEHKTIEATHTAFPYGNPNPPSTSESDGKGGGIVAARHWVEGE
jgi:hypothetical protein